jgi:hypothetical protein
MWQEICLLLASNSSLLKLSSHFIFGFSLHQRFSLGEKIREQNVVVTNVSIVADARGQKIGRNEFGA